jgi:hypothetical protein
MSASIATWYIMESKTYGRNKSKAEILTRIIQPKSKIELE